MPIEDFGFEEMMEQGDTIFLDTSTLVFNLEDIANQNSKKDYHNSLKDRDALKRLKFSRDQLERVIDFNQILALFLRENPNVNIIRDSVREYFSAESKIAKRISLRCISEKLVKPYNDSVSEIREALKPRILVPTKRFDMACRELLGKYCDMLEGVGLSDTDKRLIVYSVAGARDYSNIVLASNDRTLLTRAHVMGRSVMPRKELNLYTTLKTGRFREADSRDFVKSK